MAILARTIIEPVTYPLADGYNTDPASDVVSLKNYHTARFYVQEGAGATGTATITVEECTAIDGTGATAIAFSYRASGGEWTAATAAGFATTAGANTRYEIEVQDSGLSEDSPFVRLQFTEVVDSPVAMAAFVVAEGARYAEETPVSALS